MGNNDKYLVKYAEGKAKNLAKAWNKTRPWGEFCTDLSTPTKTGEARAKFDEMSKDEQDVLKAVAGWISTAQCENNNRSLKNILPRNLLSLDLDYCSTELKDAIEAGESPLSRFESFTHSSRRHTERKPRLRQFYPLSREVDADEYHALVRIVSYVLDGKREPIIQVDRVSARPAQMMFKPTISKDGDWFCHLQEGKLLDPDYFFDLWRKKKGDPTDLTKLPLYDTETNIRRSAEKSENPLTKPGIIGAFCRAYPIEDAMEKFLPGLYIPGDAHSGQPRYTYAGSTSSNGAIVYDDGLFLFSNHGHDPCCDQNVNAFDMVRLHLYGEEDTGLDTQNTPVNQLPSFKAMMEFARNDKGTKHELMKERYSFIEQFDNDEPVDEAEADESVEPDYDDLIGDGPAPKKKKKKKRDAWDWMDDLEIDKNGNINPNLANTTKILINDPRIGPNVAHNEFLNRKVLTGNIQTGIRSIPDLICRDTNAGDRWEDSTNSLIRLLLEEQNGDGKKGYGMKTSDRDLRGALRIAAKTRAFHPIKNYIESTEWDGKSRIETCFSDYLGCPYSEYHRQASLNFFLACVARIYKPGHKFDFVVMIQGAQGSRKSTFVLKLAPEVWTGVFNAPFDNAQRIAEQIMGKWINEMAEIHNFKKSDFGQAKEFVRRQHDDIRMAYDEEVSLFPRQCVFVGTTNDAKFLRDPTGNRSYWPIISPKTMRDPIDTDSMVRDRDQMWAEALVRFKALWEARRKGQDELDLSLKGEEAISEAERLQEAYRSEEHSEQIANHLAETLDEVMTLSQAQRLMGMGAESSFDQRDGQDPDTLRVRLCAVSQKELNLITFNSPTPRNAAESATMSHAISFLFQRHGWEKENANLTNKKQPSWKWGRTGRWFIRSDASLAAKKCGYEILSDGDDLVG